MKHRMLCHGEAQQGRVIMEDHTGEVDAYERLNKSWHHEPRCTGWDWQPEPEPEWFDLTPFDGHQMRSGVDWWWDGVEWRLEDACQINRIGTIKRLWKTSAFRCLLKDAPPELVAKASKPAEDPDEWVTITDENHVARRNIDYIRTWNGEMEPVQGLTGMLRKNITNELVCRRRDLPPMPEKPKTEREVLLYWYDGNVVGRYADCPPTDPSFVPLIVRDGRVFIETETREAVR